MSPRTEKPRPFVPLPLITRPGDPPPPCTGHPELFFPERGADPEHRALARRICDRCEHQDACRDAGRSGDEHGIWGGETRIQRTRNTR